MLCAEVCVYPRRLALSYSHSLSLNHPICYLSSLFMRFLEWLVTSFFRLLLSIYLYYLLRWWCIMIVFKIGSIRWNANVRTYFRSYKTSYKPIFLYIVYILYIGTFNVPQLSHTLVWWYVSYSSVCLHVLNRSYSIKINESK